MIKPKSVELFILDNIDNAFPKCENYFAEFGQEKRLYQITEKDFLRKKLALMALNAFNAFDLKQELSSKLKIKTCDAFNYSLAISYRTTTQTLFCPRCVLMEIILDRDIIIFFDKKDFSIKRVKYACRDFSQKIRIFKTFFSKTAYRVLRREHPNIARNPYEHIDAIL